MAELTSPGSAPANDDIREVVREKYAAAALAATDPDDASCGCGPGVFGSALYDEAHAQEATRPARSASLGCGVPTAVADLHEGETVLDLGSGAGADMLISARQAGASGQAIGLDMTDEMLELARANAAQAGVSNVEFVKGYIEDIPLPDASVDVVISNCVINLAGDKPKVLAEAERVLPAGRALRGLRRDRRSGHGRGHARRHGRLHRLHRGGARKTRVPRGAQRRGPHGHRDPQETHRVHDRAASGASGPADPPADGLGAMATALFVCRQNAGRSQMSAALFEQAAGGRRQRALSAGTTPAEHVHPEVVAVMRELGVETPTASRAG